MKSQDKLKVGDKVKFYKCLMTNGPGDQLYMEKTYPDIGTVLRVKDKSPSIMREHGCGIDVQFNRHTLYCYENELLKLEPVK